MTKRTRNQPRVALLGEFSAGKSTLTNLLLGRAQSPVRVTATQMPPLWYRYGEGPPQRLTEDGSAEELPEYTSISVPLEGTKAVQIALDAPILQRFELFDMPGSSDPNMAPDVWDRLLPEMDIAIWCTPATQAWRQSEAAMWDGISSKLKDRSMLLLTRIDKVSATDRQRVLKRVVSETEGLFRHVLPAALLSAKPPLSECDTSGMADVMEALEDLLENSEAALTPLPQPTRPEASQVVTGLRPTPVTPRRVTALSTERGQRRRATDATALF